MHLQTSACIVCVCALKTLKHFVGRGQTFLGRLKSEMGRLKMRWASSFPQVPCMASYVNFHITLSVLTLSRSSAFSVGGFVGHSTDPAFSTAPRAEMEDNLRNDALEQACVEFVFDAPKSLILGPSTTTVATPATAATVKSWKTKRLNTKLL